jgi:hypothetical protein
MVAIPDRLDPTLEAVNSAMESEQSPYVSKNIGFGEIGHECSRYLWYKINTDVPEVFSSNTLRIFRDGHQAESRMADDLRKVQGINLYTNDPERENKQYKFDLLDGRLTGRLDGVIVGLLQAPKTPHIWEHKNVNEKKFKALQKTKSIKGWDDKYDAQAHLAMYASELDRHYLTCSTPGLRSVTSVRTELDRKFAEGLVDKAERIINAKSPPERIGGPDWFQCTSCRFYEECHGYKRNS